MDAKSILKGESSADKESNITHPLVKSSFVLFYLFICASLIAKRYITGQLDVTTLWFTFFFSYILSSLDLRREYIYGWLKRAVTVALCSAIPVVSGSYIDVESTDFVRWAKYISGYISAEDLIIFLYAFGAVLTVNRIYSMDMLWLSNILPRWLNEYVTVFIVGYFVVRRFLSESITEIFRSASLKRRLAKNKTWYIRWKIYVRSVGIQIITKFQRIKTVTQNLLKERNLLKPEIRDDVNTYFTREDYIALPLLLVTIVFIYVNFLGYTVSAIPLSQP